MKRNETLIAGCATLMGLTLFFCSLIELSQSMGNAYRENPNGFVVHLGAAMVFAFLSWTSFVVGIESEKKLE